MFSNQIKKGHYMNNFFIPKSEALSPWYADLNMRTQRALLHSARKQCHDGLIACVFFVAAAIAAAIVEPNKWAIITCLGLALVSLVRNAIITIRYRRGWFGRDHDEAEMIIRDAKR
jgi:hypothetical protein